GAHHLRPRAEAAALAGLRAARGAGPGGGRHVHRHSGQHLRSRVGPRVDLLRSAVGVPGPAPVLADPAGDRPVPVVPDHLPRDPLPVRTESKFNMPWLFLYAGLAIPAFYAVGLLATTDTHLTVAEFWRFWVVHLWVEDFLELFTTVMVAYIFVMLGVVRRKIAIQVILLDVILYSMGGVIGTM